MFSRLLSKNNKIKIIYSATSASLGNKGKDQYLSPYAYSKAQNLKMITSDKQWFGILSMEILYFYNAYERTNFKGKMATVTGIFEEHYKNKNACSGSLLVLKVEKSTQRDDTVNGCYLAWKNNKNYHYSLANNKAYKIIQVAKLFSKKIKYLKPR